MCKKADNKSDLLSELIALNAKYGLPKSIGFVPDKIQVTIERAKNDVFELIYSESFTYLPDKLIPYAINNAIEIAKGMGHEPDQFTRIIKGIEFKHSSDFNIICGIILEFFMQDKNLESKLEEYLNELRGVYKKFIQLIEPHYTYNDEIENKIKEESQNIEKIIREKPNILSERQKIIDKYRARKKEADGE
jgi:hypothetical protein